APKPIVPHVVTSQPAPTAATPSFEPAVRKPIEQPQPTRTVYTLGGNETPEGHYAPNAEERALQEAENRKMLQRRADERRERLRKLSSENNSETIKEKLDVPAYLRRNVALETVAHSSERNISLFNLNDDNEILGDNRFLHDNVD